jgi:hypothetical protein
MHLVGSIIYILSRYTVNSK